MLYHQEAEWFVWWCSHLLVVKPIRDSGLVLCDTLAADIHEGEDLICMHTLQHEAATEIVMMVLKISS